MERPHKSAILINLGNTKRRSLIILLVMKMWKLKTNGFILKLMSQVSGPNLENIVSIHSNQGCQMSIKIKRQ